MDSDFLKKEASEESDEILLRLISEKDESALSLFYDRKSSFVYSLILNVVKNKLDAEELTEEVFFRVWSNADSYNLNRGSVMAWLTTITRRIAIDRLRSRQFKSSGRDVSIDVLDEKSSNRPNHGEQFAITSDISKALNQLDIAHQEIIKLSYYDGLSQSMIADRTNTPLGTVKSRTREALKQLRELLFFEDNK
jgi:RNA polymerase sigma-70 factor (ECF subfamily)